MKFSLTIENMPARFRVNVHDETTGNIVFDCGWHGGEFTYQKKLYGVFGPYHSFDGQAFRVYELVPASDPK